MNIENLSLQDGDACVLTLPEVSGLGGKNIHIRSTEPWKSDNCSVFENGYPPVNVCENVTEDSSGFECDIKKDI